MRQGRRYLKIVIVLIVLASIAHLFLGAPIAVVLMGAATVLLSMLPIVHFGSFDLAAILIALVGLRYVGFPLFTKLLMGQSLDSHLLDPKGSFGVVLVGVLGYLGAFWIASRMQIGRPLLKQVSGQRFFRRISFLAAAVGIAANLAIAFRTGEEYSGIKVAEFFVSFLHLALIAGIARAIVASDRRRSVDPWIILLVTAEVTFGMVNNSRVALMETLLCFVVTVSAFEYKIRWRQFGIVFVFMGSMVLFITPVFLYVRNLRDLSWTSRIAATMDAATNWSEAFSYFLRHRDTQDQLGWYLNYYGSPQNVFERMSYINHVDVLKNGVDASQRAGFEDLRLSLERVIPRVFAPDKPREYSQGYWLYSGIGIPYPGPFATAPLIGTGYAAFTWIGSFLYPFALGLVWLLIIKKITGWKLNDNIWVIYMLLRVHNQFVEGSSDSYLIYILRSLPQDFVILWILDAVGRGRLLNLWRKTPVISYGK